MSAEHPQVLESESDLLVLVQLQQTQRSTSADSSASAESMCSQCTATGHSELMKQGGVLACEHVITVTVGQMRDRNGAQYQLRTRTIRVTFIERLAEHVQRLMGKHSLQAGLQMIFWPEIGGRQRAPHVQSVQVKCLLPMLFL